MAEAAVAYMVFSLDLLSGASSWVDLVKGLVPNVRPILSHTVLTVKAQLAIVPWMTLVFSVPPLLSGTPFHRSMSMLPEKPTQSPGQQSRFVLRAPPRPSGLNSADDCSLDVHQIWRHWERCMHFSPQQLPQCITEVGLCHGFDPFLVAAIVRDHAMGSTGLRMRRRRPTCRRMRPRLIWIITA